MAVDGPNSDQVQGCKRTRHVSSALLSAWGKDHALAPRRPSGHRWNNPTTQEACCPHLDESLVQHPVRESVAKAGLTKRATATPSGISLPRMGSTEGQRGFAVRRRGCEPFHNGLTLIHVKYYD